MDARRQLHLSFEFGGVAVHAGTQLWNGRSSTSRDYMWAFKDPTWRARVSAASRQNMLVSFWRLLVIDGRLTEWLIEYARASFNNPVLSFDLVKCWG